MKKFIALIFTVMISPMSLADVTLPKIISDRMVLQSGVEVTIWGSADKGEPVTVNFAGQSQKTVTNQEGHWSTQLSPLKGSSNGQKLTVTGKNKIEVEDVLVGEVWLASGQSNMATGIKQSPGA